MFVSKKSKIFDYRYEYILRNGDVCAYTKSFDTSDTMLFTKGKNSRVYYTDDLLIGIDKISSMINAIFDIVEIIDSKTRVTIWKEGMLCGAV